MQASGHKQRPWEAEILCLELSPEEGFTPDELVQRALQPSLRVAAWQVTTLPEKATLPGPCHHRLALGMLWGLSC